MTFGYGPTQQYETLASFMYNLPFMAYLTMEAVMFFHVFFIVWDINLVPANINFKNLQAINTLGNIDSIVCSKSAFFAERGLRNIVAFKVGKTTCENDVQTADERDSQNMTRDADSLNSSNDSAELTKHELDYLPNQVKQEDFFSSKAIEQL